MVAATDILVSRLTKHINATQTTLKWLLLAFGLRGACCGEQLRHLSRTTHRNADHLWINGTDTS